MRGRRASVVAVCAAALLCAACTALPAGGSAPAGQPASVPSAPPPSGVSALLVQPVQDAQVVRASDGDDHVEDDLLVVSAFFGHLQPGSVTERTGERERTGQVLGRLGHAGPSQSPHLHVGLLEAPDSFTGRSLPFVLTTATLTGTVDVAASTGDTLTVAPASRRVRDAYPLYGTIMDSG